MKSIDLSTKIETTIRTLLTDHTVATFLRKTSDTLRTSLIKTNLCELGKSLNFHVSASGCAADDGEWLYDMVWSNMKDGQFTHQAMVLECEWRMGVSVARSADVDSDFQKLVQARADVRVWICTVHNSEIAARHIENCKKEIEEFSGTMSDDHYLFVILIGSNDSFAIEAFLPHRGALQPFVVLPVSVPQL